MSPQVIFLHILLEQLVSSSSNVPSFNRCRSTTEMDPEKGKFARRERRERKEVSSRRHFEIACVAGAKRGGRGGGRKARKRGKGRERLL